MACMNGTLHFVLVAMVNPADFSPLARYLNGDNVRLYCFGRDGARRRYAQSGRTNRYGTGGKRATRVFSQATVLPGLCRDHSRTFEQRTMGCRLAKD